MNAAYKLELQYSNRINKSSNLNIRQVFIDYDYLQMFKIGGSFRISKDSYYILKQKLPQKNKRTLILEKSHLKRSFKALQKHGQYIDCSLLLTLMP